MTVGGITISPVKFVDEDAPKKWWFWLISELERACRCSVSLHRRSLCPLAAACAACQRSCPAHRSSACPAAAPDLQLGWWLPSASSSCFLCGAA